MTEQDDFLKWPDRGVDHDDVIELFCKLQSRVRNTHPLKDPGASDCFCGRGKGFWGVDEYDGTHEGGYRNDGVVFERIVACCEAMQGVEDPAAFVEAVRAWVRTHMDPHSDGEDLDHACKELRSLARPLLAKEQSDAE
jgi:hypothetical protein